MFEGDSVLLPLVDEAQITWAAMYKMRIMNYFSMVPIHSYPHAQLIIQEAIRFEQALKGVDSEAEDDKDPDDIVGTMPADAPVWAVALAKGINQLNCKVKSQVEEMTGKLEAIEEKLGEIESQLEDVGQGVEAQADSLSEACLDKETFDDGLKRQIAITRNIMLTSQGYHTLVPVPNDAGLTKPKGSAVDYLTDRSSINTLNAGQLALWLNHYGLRHFRGKTLEEQRQALRLEIGSI
ncbi:hypothetical protein DXG01_009330 [Tephrocybe rancida]|nr:hypothetical protein DXG01_009330 [Tephrocybe rancida]